jgi:hypothetical protein
MGDRDLRSLTKEDWWQVCQELRPDVTRPEFELMWRGFRSGLWLDRLQGLVAGGLGHLPAG